MSYDGINYIDDLGGAEEHSKAERAFQSLGDLLEKLGVEEATAKVVPPSTVMSFLGVLCDTDNFMLQITPDRLTELRSYLEWWRKKKSASLKEVQSLAGKLNFVCYTVRSGRVFLSRILHFLRSFSGKPGSRLVDPAIRKDVSWWAEFMEEFNGVSMFPDSRWCPPDFNISTDSCLTGFGGWSQGDYFHCRFPDFIVNDTSLTTNELECFAVVIAIKLWVGKFKNANLLMHCDNESTCFVINNGRANHPFTQACLRELVWWSAKHNLWVKMCHISGVSNRFSDLLSRWHLDSHYEQLFFKETQGLHRKEYYIEQSMFTFINKW